jgi:hypothetical protein
MKKKRNERRKKKNDSNIELAFELDSRMVQWRLPVVLTKLSLSTEFRFLFFFSSFHPDKQYVYIYRHHNPASVCTCTQVVEVVVVSAPFHNVGTFESEFWLARYSPRGQVNISYCYTGITLFHNQLDGGI